MVLTCKQTPRFCGHWSKTGALLNLRGTRRRLRTSWLIVGMDTPKFLETRLLGSREPLIVPGWLWAVNGALTEGYRPLAERC